MGKKILKVLVLFIIAINIMAFFHAWRFTHFPANNSSQTAPPEKLNFLQKTTVLFTGISNPKSRNQIAPDSAFEEFQFLVSSDTIEGWFIPSPNDLAAGTVIILHGYGGNKSSMLPIADSFKEMNWNAVLIDFPGHGNSSGYSTSIGYNESTVVRAAFKYTQSKAEGKPVIIYGTSMGAAAAMKAVSQEGVKPTALILECPFGSMLQTVKNRFTAMGLPSTPAAHLLTFWGGIQQGFWAFGYKPSEYAKGIYTPVLMMHGDLDPRVSKEKTEEIFNNLKGPKTLVNFPGLGHELYILSAKEKWHQSVRFFIGSVAK